jgi:hypothetical protein
MEHQHAKGEHKYEIFEVPDEYRKQLWGVVQKYLLLQDALASDDRDGAARAAGETLEALSAVDMSLLSGEAHNVWTDNSVKDLRRFPMSLYLLWGNLEFTRTRPCTNFIAQWPLITRERIGCKTTRIHVIHILAHLC